MTQATTTDPDAPLLVSAHGGHSGEFCLHAEDTLEAIVGAYIEKGFGWVGITEHMPPLSDAFRYPDETDAGLSAAELFERFGRYMATGRRLQEKCAGQIRILVGFETETYSGSAEWVRRLVAAFRPDYFVGSVHHVADLNFDFSREAYDRAAAALGGLDRLYCHYFDEQHDMLTALRPPVVGHFDLVRIHDPHYRSRLLQPDIRRRVRRNLERIRDLGLILDVNCRALYKGAAEPYPSASILSQARDLEISVLPGDDSHGCRTVGFGVADTARMLARMGFDTGWRLPPPVSG